VEHVVGGDGMGIPGGIWNGVDDLFGKGRQGGWIIVACVRFGVEVSCWMR
jgi:hypothetical protein